MSKVKKEKARKNGAVAIATGAAALLTVIIIAIIAANIGRLGPFNDDYFVSDGTKLVLNIDGSMVSTSADEKRPVMAHNVYYYSGDKIKDVKVFFEYEDADAAKAANEVMGDGYKEWAKSKQISGKYIVFLANDVQYKDLATEDVKQIIEDMEGIEAATDL